MSGCLALELGQWRTPVHLFKVREIRFRLANDSGVVYFQANIIFNDPQGGKKIVEMSMVGVIGTVLNEAGKLDCALVFGDDIAFMANPRSAAPMGARKNQSDGFNVTDWNLLFRKAGTIGLQAVQ